MTMRQSLKHNFVEKIANKKVDELKGNYQDHPASFNEYRKELLHQAETLLESKSKQRLQSKKEKYELQQNI